MREFRIVGVASLSTLYCPAGVKKSFSLTSSGQTPSAIRTIQRNYVNDFEWEVLYSYRRLSSQGDHRR